jgi:hypothetical protein
MQRMIKWTNPTTYADGSPIEPEYLPLIKIRVWKDGVETYSTLPGVVEWPIEVERGVQNSWQLQTELNGALSELSPPFLYTEPFPNPMPPTNITIE